MTKERALEILTTHNEWRRNTSDTPRPMVASGVQIGIAIDIAIEALKKEVEKEGVVNAAA